VFYPKERVLAIFMGAPGFLGRGYWRIKCITLTNPPLNLCPISEGNLVKLLDHSLWSLCCWVLVATPVKEPVDS
jgi:hypothetical protein